MTDVSDTNFDFYFRASVLWGAILGFVTYVTVRFPWWFVLNVPDDGQRGPFFKPVETLIVVLLGVVISAVIFRVLMRKKHHLLFSLGYPFAALLLPFALVALIIFPAWFISPGSPPDWTVPIVGWIFASSLPLICLLPFGVLSATLFYLATRSKYRW